MVTLVELETVLNEATRAHQSALNAESEARRNATVTVNALNKAQRELDEYVASLRGQAPRGSDWNSDAIRGGGING